MDEKPFVAVELRHTVATESDDGGLDFGRRIEDVLVDGEEVFYVVEGGEEDAEDAIGLAAGTGGDAFGHLFLEHADEFVYLVAVLKNAEEYLRRDIVREVADDGEGFGEDGFEVEPEEIALDEVEGRVVVVEVCHRLAVYLDGFEMKLRVVDEVFGEDAHAGAYLEQAVDVRADAAGYALGNALVGEKMLS